MVMEGFLTDPPPPPLSSELSIQTILSPRHRLKSSHFFFFHARPLLDNGQKTPVQTSGHALECQRCSMPCHFLLLSTGSNISILAHSDACSENDSPPTLPVAALPSPSCPLARAPTALSSSRKTPMAWKRRARRRSPRRRARLVRTTLYGRVGGKKKLDWLLHCGQGCHLACLLLIASQILLGSIGGCCCLFFFFAHLLTSLFL